MFAKCFQRKALSEHYLFKQIQYTFTFTFMHLADAFMQSDLLLKNFRLYMFLSVQYILFIDIYIYIYSFNHLSSSVIYLDYISI